MGHIVSLSNVIKTRSIVTPQTFNALEGGVLKFNFKRSAAHRFQVKVVLILYMFNQSGHSIGRWKLAIFSATLHLSCQNLMNYFVQSILHSGLDNSAFMVPMSEEKDNSTEKCQQVGIILISSPCNTCFLCTLNKTLKWLKYRKSHLRGKGGLIEMGRLFERGDRLFHIEKTMASVLHKEREIIQSGKAQSRRRCRSCSRGSKANPSFQSQISPHEVSQSLLIQSIIY